MGRIHLFEFGDQTWFPRFLRNYQTDFLQFLSNATKLYKPIIPVLEKGLAASGNEKVIDLCSGGGGGLIWLQSELQKNHPDLKIILTDIYPNLPAFERIKDTVPGFDFVSEPVDVLKVPAHLSGLRTMFLSFHHFEAGDATAILQNAVESRTPIAIFEAQERSVLSILAMLFSPINILLTTPFIRPFKWGRLVFTYIIPIMPIVTVWDGVVSSLRTYSPREMNSLIASLSEAESFDWEVGKLKSGPARLIYTLGVPKDII